ncbi:hypothetical protein [Paraburkholderia adhaesiva]|uniref:hypothetical protein n=1 Tax=Paraburkholderia adhaesiva TaxID=2883244 RepID=UPI001F3B4E31|nr:hypothetical protein [Paraburkholderia adhaesiva]
MTIRTAWQCDAQGVFIGETIVQEDPLTPGTFLLPPGCVLHAPPAFEPVSQTAVWQEGAWAVHALPPPEEAPVPATPDEGAPSVPPSIVVPTPENRPAAGAHEIAVIAGGQWAVVADWRDTAYWLADGSAHRITALGETPPENALFAAPPELSMSLAEAQAARIAQLRAAWQAAGEAPVSFTTAAGHTDLYACDAASIANLDAMLAANTQAGSWPPDLWLTAGGLPVSPFTWNDLEGLARTIANRAQPDYAALLVKIAAVMAATTVAQVGAITWQAT